MTELLAIFEPSDSDETLVREIARRHPRRVTVLLEDVDAGWALDESPTAHEIRDRLARLMAAIERDTGATVTGLAGARDQLAGWRFDGEVTGRAPVVA